MPPLRIKISKEMMDIRHETSNTTYRWISFTSIEELINDANEAEVVAELKEATQANAEELEKLKRFTFQKAKRLFALLVVARRLKWIKTFFEHDFGDDMFPIKLLTSNAEGNPTWEIESMKGENRVRYKEKGAYDEAADTIIDSIGDSSQWRFFVPVFGPGDPDHEFDRNCKLPFLKEFKPKKTNFSVVRHFVIDKRHLNFPKDDQIVSGIVPFQQTKSHQLSAIQIPTCANTRLV